MEYLGAFDALIEKIRALEADEIIDMGSDFSPEEQREIFEFSRIYGLEYKYIANFFDTSKLHSSLTFINQTPFVEIKSIGLSPWGRVFKRGTDIIASALGIVLLSPFFAVVAVLIKAEDPEGPVLFKNRRVGRNGEPFLLYKLRYLQWKYCVKDAYGVDEKDDEALRHEKELIRKQSERHGPLYKIADDPRKTKVGVWLEFFSIDELPQLYNVLKGDMSLVGPRPHQPREVQEYKEWQKRVLTCKPGITGMAQVHGRHKNSFDEEVRLDIFYIENWSPLLDLKIVLKTIGAVMGRKKG